MQGTCTTVQGVAEDAARWFETSTRPSGESFVRLVDGAPEWLRELVREAHGTDQRYEGEAPTLMLPDDWRYQFVRDAFDFIAESDDPDGELPDFVDNEASVYTNDLLAWAGSHAWRLGYVDEAMEGYGDVSGLGISKLLQLGQMEEAGEVYRIVLDRLEDAVEAAEGGE